MIDIAPIKKAALMFKARSEAYEITDDLSFDAANEDLKAIKAKYKEIEAKRVAITKPQNDAIKQVNALFKPPLQYLKDAEELLKSRILVYQTKKKRERAIAQAEAAKKVKEEKARLAAEAEKLKASASLEDQVQAMIMESQAKTLAVAEAPKIGDDKISIKTRKDVTVTDLKAFLQAIIDGHTPENAITVNMAVVRAAWKAGNPFIGCSEIEEKSVAVRS